MKIGCCVNMFGNEQDPTGSAWLKTLSDCGYDYAELPLAQIMDLDEPAFKQLLCTLRELKLPCDCCNNFFPALVRITGADASPEKIEEYAQRAVSRASRLGAKILVFGSSGAKNVPKGFSQDTAFTQIAQTLRIVGGLCVKQGITVAIEPLNHLESNIIVNLTDGMRLVEAAASEAVRLLVDYYHFTLEQETLSTLREAKKYLVHAHFANPSGRRVPAELLADYSIFLNELKSDGYTGRVSIEAYSDSVQQDLSKAICWLKDA